MFCMNINVAGCGGAKLQFSRVDSREQVAQMMVACLMVARPKTEVPENYIANLMAEVCDKEWKLVTGNALQRYRSEYVYLEADVLLTITQIEERSHANSREWYS